MFTPFGKDNPRVIAEFQEEINRLMNRLWHSGISTAPFDGQDWAPAWDVYEDDDRFVALIEIAGIDPACIEAACVGQTLTIKGHRPHEFEGGKEPNYLRRERRFGAFSRTVNLPEEVESDKITATCKNGLLAIVIPKKIEAAKRVVKINVKGD